MNHSANEPMLSRDLDFEVAIEAIEKTVEILKAEAFKSTRIEWSINFQGTSRVSLQRSCEDLYHDFLPDPVPADIFGILMRLATLADTLAGKIEAWSDSHHRQSKCTKDLSDIIRLVKARPLFGQRFLAS